MVTAMLCRIHQSGRLDEIPANVAAQVKNGIKIYKEVIRKHIGEAAPFYPLGMPDVTNRERPVALGMRAPGWTALAVWRLEGADTVEVPLQAANARRLYPDDLRIQIQSNGEKLTVRFPRPKMGCIILA
jgi:alpha-galactosidase